MFYFLCEGEKNKSEYIFIKSVIDEFNNGESYVLLSANGKENIVNVFYDNICDRLCSGDIFILFFDKVEVIGGSLVHDMLLDISEMCDTANVFFKYTTYYCFEELFLTYAGLFSLIHLDINSEKDLRDIQSKILNGIDYFNVCNLSVWEKFLGNGIDNFTTREQFSSALCAALLRRANGRFIVKKDIIGDCWIKSCKDIDKSKLGNGIVCEKKCTYCCKNSSFRDKLADLDKRSVSKLSFPFSDVFRDSI